MLTALETEWTDNPPTNWLVAGFVGYKKKRKGKPSDLLGMFPGGKIR